jgi:Ca-activated chloride channel family protein
MEENMERIGNKFILVIVLIFGFSLTLFADGFIVVPGHHRPRPPVPHPPFTPFPLEVKYHRVKIDIQDQIAVTAIDQVFYNPTNRRLEGYYLFPLPAHAVIKRFSMFVDGKEMEAELLDAKKARKIYEDIVRRQRDPALLEYSTTGVFKARIFPIEPRSEKRVKISYREVLNKDNNTIEYLYPLNTEKFSAKPLKDVSIQIDIKSQGNIKNVYCPTHLAEVKRKDRHRVIVGYEEANSKPDRDFKIYYSSDDGQLGFSLYTYKEKKRERGYFFLSLSPGFDLKNNNIEEKDITFVLDVSGSMAGKKLNQAKKALLFCIHNLNQGDRFEIIRFSTEAEALFREFAQVNEEKLGEAEKFIDDLKAMGGTNINEALAMALGMKKREKRPYMVIFLTDGKPTIGETSEDTIIKTIMAKNIHNTRIFTFGIGNEINTHLLDKITEITHAYRSYISPEEDIEIKVSNFYTKVQSPVLTDLALKFDGEIRISKTYPIHLPDLFKGSNLSVLGRYQGHGDANLVLTGKVKGEEKTFRFRKKGGFKSYLEKDTGKHDFIPPLWAARRVGYLLDQIRLHGKAKELIDEVTSLARTYGILTPYTSYLIVEDEINRTRRRLISKEEQTLAQITPKDQEFTRRAAEEYRNLRKKGGAPSVRASKEVQDLNIATNYAQTQQGKSRLGFIDHKGQKRNLVQQVKNIQGRAIYNTGKFWLDSRVQNEKSKQTQKIQFASSDYFKLLEEEPLSAQFLALGKNVRFVLKDTIYEIYE